MLFLLSCLLLQAQPSSETVLIPLEDNRWESRLKKAEDLIGRGEFGEAIQILQSVIEEDAARDALRPLAGASGASGAARPATFPPTPPTPLPGLPVRPARQPKPAEDSTEPAEVAGAEPEEETRRGLTTYIPVAEFARRLLWSLPPEGLAAYRRLHGGPARQLYAEALRSGDRDLLESVARDTFLTAVGDDALDRLGELFFFEGRFWAAVDAWRRVLNEHPDPDVNPVEVRLKILHALRLLGAKTPFDAERESFLAQLRAQAGGDGLAGRDEVYRARLLNLEQTLPFPPAAGEQAIGPGLAGPVLGSTPGLIPDLPGRRLDADWASPFWAAQGISPLGVPGGGRGGLGAARSFSLSRREPQASFPFYPSVGPGPEAGFLYIGSVFQLQRLSLSTGKLVGPIYRLPHRDNATLFQEASDSPAYTVALGAASGWRGPRDLVIGSYIGHRIPHRDYLSFEITAELPIRSLAAFERDSGRVVWKTDELAIPGVAGKKLSFTTPVLLDRGKAIAGGWLQSGYINSILACIDLSTGDLVWHQLVASHQMELTMFGEMAREPFASQLTEREGVVYFVTNLGAIAAVDSKTGRLLWVTAYETIPAEPPDRQLTMLREIVWGVNPPLFVGETLIVAPRDSHFLYAIDTVSAGGRRGRDAAPERQAGRVLWKYSNVRGQLRDLLGVSRGRLYFSGPGGVQALDIDRVPPDGSPRLLPAAPALAGKMVNGRGALTSAGVLVAAGSAAGFPPRGFERLGEKSSVPGGCRLYLVDHDLRRASDLTGPLLAQNPDSEGWNVLVAMGRVFLTSRTAVIAFSARPEPEPPKPEPPKAGTPTSKPASKPASASKEDL